MWIILLRYEITENPMAANNRQWTQRRLNPFYIA